jgi:hypothetical protein
MITKKCTLLLLAGTLGLQISVMGQVNLAKGSLNTGIPLAAFKDPLSRLSLSVGLQYSSGNGLRVNETAGSVGTGWLISGLSFITRTTQQLPDDQRPRNGDLYDTTKYPPGYQYAAAPVGNGCPIALTTYPIFQEKFVAYQDDNNTMADRQLDYFFFSLNGRSGTFVVGKNREAVCLSDNRLKITVSDVGGLNNEGCRTSWGLFTITDENGLVYEFGQRENTRVYAYRNGGDSSGGFTNYLNNYTKVEVERRINIPDNQSPFVTNSWYISAIKDPKAKRSIVFEYDLQLYDGESARLIQYNAPFQTYSGGDMSKTKFSLKITRQRSTVQHPEIKRIRFPDGSKVLFAYNHARKDLPGVSALTAVSSLNDLGETLHTYELGYSYFVKHQIKTPAPGEEKWSRLCLQSVQQKSAQPTVLENPTRFDYYCGSNATEDFVPPPYFHAQDPWGYYNGQYSGVPLDRFLGFGEEDRNAYIKLALFNDADNNEPITALPDFKANAKPGFAKNGLLKSITSPFGGTTVYEYEQNRASANVANSIDSGVVGGVHLSKIIRQGAGGQADIITQYRYVDDNGASSLWGAEMPRNRLVLEAYYEPAQKTYFPSQGCKYTYQYPGNTRKMRADNGLLLQVVNIIINIAINSAMQQLMVTTASATSGSTTFDPTFLITIAIGDIISCFLTPQDGLTKTVSHVNGANNFGNALPMLFRQVEEKTYSSDGTQAGKTVHRFTSDLDFPLLVPQNNYPYVARQRGFNWAYGLPQKTVVYNNAGQPLAITENYYRLVQRELASSNTLNCQCTPHYVASMRSDQWQAASNVYFNYAAATIPDTLTVELYNIKTGRMELDSSRQTILDTSGYASHTVTRYQYNAHNYLPAVVATTDSKGKLQEARTYYLEDYDLNLPNHGVLRDMRFDNMVNIPLATETWQTKPVAIGGTGLPELLAASATEFGQTPHGDYRPLKSYALVSDQPVPLAQVGPFNPQQLLSSPLLLPQTQTVYDSVGNAVQTTELRGQRTSCVVYDYAHCYAVATVSNAAAHEVAYTSFEADGANSRWLPGYNLVVTEPCPTGNNCLVLDPTGLATTVSITKDYVLSFWATTAGVTIGVPGATLAVSAPTINGWTYYEYSLPAGSPSPVLRNNSGSLCKIDEVRLYPQGATMATTTYAPGIGKTCVCDANNRMAYFTYDALGRPDKEKDAQGNVVKVYEYGRREW